MKSASTHRIAERFARLSLEQRRQVYKKIELEGLVVGQFPILRREDSLQSLCPASYAQIRQWFLWQLEPASTAYHISGALRLKGELDVDALKASFDALVARHESLRTVFRGREDGQVEQLILDENHLSFEETDLSTMAEAERTQETQALAVRLHQRPFDLEHGPLLRVGLIREATDKHLLMVVMHHIISDGWSMQIIVDEFVAQYRARIQGEVPKLAALPIQYADYAVWQHQWLEAGEKDRQLAYWQTQLGCEHPVLQLPTDYPRRTDGRYTAAHHGITLPAELVRHLRERARAEEATLFMVLLTGLQTLLHRYSGQDDIRVGVPIANRHRVETEGVVGFFVNTQVLPTVVDTRSSLNTVLQQVKGAALGAQSHQDLPFEQLVEALQPERNLGTNPLFQVMYNHQRQDRRPLETLPGLSIEGYALGEQGAQFELTVDTSEASDGQLGVTLTYAKELFDAVTIERMVAHYQAVLTVLAEQPQQGIGEIELLSEAEKKQLVEWGVNSTRYSDSEPVYRLIERQVQTDPTATALIFNDEHLSYAELNARSNRLAHCLIRLGVKPEVKVGIAAERSIEMVVGLLGILKAGGAYVPLDPEYPQERLGYMIEDSGIDLLLTQSCLRGALPLTDVLQVLELDTLNLGDESKHDPQVAVHGENLAYVIYTSGSTGKPKGAANRHRALYNRLQWMQDAYRLDESDTVLQKTPFSFDVSVWEFFWPLMVGARLALAKPGDHRDPARLVELITAHDVTTLHFVPSMLQAFLGHEGIEACTGLRRVICSGEALSVGAQQAVFKRLPQVALHNLYGPTEAAIDVTHWTCCDDDQNSVPIGQPISGIQTWVLDDGLKPVPQGVVGELYLGGVGLARGYLQRAGLTGERFIADPQSNNGECLYRTGDLVRWNADGQLEYLGRIDHQVKIRGFRIELGEVEAQLLAQSEIREAVAVANESSSGTRLVAYVCAVEGEAIDSALIRERLGQTLPDYMVPSVVVELDKLPLNDNGKVNRKALPAHDIVSQQEYESPQGELEETLASIWSEVLGVERVGRHDNFFELGGHSISALRVVTKIRKIPLVSGLCITLKDMMTKPTLHSLMTATASQVILLNENCEECVPLFCIHAGFGTTLGYLQLAKRFNSVRSVYGIVCRTLFDPSHRDESIEAIAKNYVSLIQTIQPRGPYCLLGWSLGGPIAALIAANFEEQGQRVAFLGLVDPPLLHLLQKNMAGMHWQRSFNNFLQIVCGTESDPLSVPDYIVDPLDNEQPLLEWIRLQIDSAHIVPKGLYEGLTAEDLSRGYLTGRSLELAVKHSAGSLREIKAAVDLWWVKDRPRIDTEQLAGQLGVGRVRQLFVDADHNSIIYNESFLQGLRRKIMLLETE